MTPHARIKKKLSHASTTADYGIIAEWIKSITNHLYWCAASALDGDGNDMVKHWKSLIDHICDIHEDCYHEPSYDRLVKYLSVSTLIRLI